MGNLCYHRMKLSSSLLVLPPAKTAAGFEGLSMRSTAVVFLLAFLLSPQLTGAIEVSGDQWGVWMVESNPYEVVGEVRVPPESTLVIEPGVIVTFKGYYSFIVDTNAILQAIGTETDSIYFTTDDTTTGWHGIRFIGADERSELRYCIVEHGRALGAYPDRDGAGVYCKASSITITNNTFKHNSGTGSGGGLCLITRSLATVVDNLFFENTAWWGGGMRCKGESAATVSGNIFIGNRSFDTAGGLSCSYSDAVVTSNVFQWNQAPFGAAINVRYCSPTIVGNLIENNQSGHGGGINTRYSEASIKRNIIRYNSGEQGGGVYSGRSKLILVSNTISNNSSVEGGGMYVGNSAPYLEGNTIAFNSAEQRGGGFYWTASAESTITNTILWGNEAPVGPQIYAHGEGPEMTYCDIQGGWPGQGNIDSNPMFVGSILSDFSIRWRSPCIDHGNPETNPDPDQTQADIGGSYFDQRARVFIEVWPQREPMVIPPEGGNVNYEYWAYNFAGGARKGDIWIYVDRPDQGRTLIKLLEDVTIPPQDSVGESSVRQHIIKGAPEGYYTVVTCIGDYPSSVNDSSYFLFYKERGVGVDGDSHDWRSPAAFSLGQNYPNPFNARTVIGYQLPTDAYVKVQVYDLLGRKVVTLFEGKQEAGQRSVFWDASEVSSGLYFYRLTANRDGEQLFSDVKKMLLVK
jgi:hypothetical protein